MKKTICFLFLAFLLGACSSGFKEYQKVSDLKWDEDEEIGFEFEIQDNSQSYDLIFLLRHNHIFPLQKIRVKTFLKSPNGKSVTKTFDIPVRTAEGEYIGSGLGDLYDLEHTLETGFQFKDTGTYSIKFVPEKEITPVPMVMEVGLRVKPVE